MRDAVRAAEREGWDEGDGDSYGPTFAARNAQEAMAVLAYRRSRLQDLDVLTSQ